MNPIDSSGSRVFGCSSGSKLTLKGRPGFEVTSLRWIEMG